MINTPPSATATAGQAFLTQPVIWEEDQYGNLETGDSSTQVTVSLASGAGPLQGTTMKNLSAGVATFAGLADTTAETITLSFSGGGFTAGPSTVVVSPAAAAKLVIKTQPSQTATAGQAFATQPVVWEEDKYGNLETADNNTVVTALLATGAGPLKGTVTATLSGGVATFRNLSDDTAETIALNLTGGGISSPPSGSIVVNPAPATNLVIAQAQPASVTAGSGFGMVVESVDPYGNLDPTFNGSVTIALASNPNSETLGGTSTVTATAGVATFTGLTLDTPGGSYSLQASSGKLASQPTATTQVAPSSPPNNAPTPTAVVTISNAKSKNTVATVITIQYSTAMDSTSAARTRELRALRHDHQGQEEKENADLDQALAHRILRSINQHRHTHDQRQEKRIPDRRPALDRRFAIRRAQPGGRLPRRGFPVLHHHREREGDLDRA